MDTDLVLILGIAIGALSVPAMVSALSDGYAPRSAAIMLLLSGGMILFALISHPTGYRIDQMAEVFFGVIARFIP